MKLNQILKLSVLSSLVGCSKPIEVEEAHLLYSSEPMISKGFYTCSEVIVDYGDSATFAHAWPLLDPRLRNKKSFREFFPVTTDNVIDQILEETERQGESKGEAHIYGPKRFTSIIINSLYQAGIPAHSISTREELGIEHCVDITYNPKTNRLVIEENVDCYLRD